MSKSYTAAKIAVALALGIGLAFAVIVLAGLLREFTQAGLEGEKFSHYYSFFLASLWIILLAILLASRNRPLARQFWFWAIAGAIGGYLSGILSINFIELSRPGGWSSLMVQSHRASYWITTIGYPLISLNWLTGFVAGSLANCMMRYVVGGWRSQQ